MTTTTAPARGTTLTLSGGLEVYVSSVRAGTIHLRWTSEEAGTGKTWALVDVDDWERWLDDHCAA
jgi:hypothetical protein